LNPYTPDTAATAALNSGPNIPQAVRNGNAGLPLYQIEQLIFHDLDDNSVGFVTYGNTTARAPVVVGSVTYSANITLSATWRGRSSLAAGKAPFSSFFVGRRPVPGVGLLRGVE
jgi:hypothetical protein